MFRITTAMLSMAHCLLKRRPSCRGKARHISLQKGAKELGAPWHRELRRDGLSALLSGRMLGSVSWVLLLVILFGCNGEMLNGATYQVAPHGLDTGPGSAERPWKTIQKAANSLQPGDMVLIRSGTYRERVVPARSGSTNLEIVYAAYPGELVTVDGTGVTMPDDLAGLFEVYNRSHIRVSGLSIINAGVHNDNAGIMVRNSQHIIIHGNAVSNTVSSGIGVWESDHVVVVSNRVDTFCTGGWQEGISVALTDTFEVLHNHVSLSKKEGICIKHGSRSGKIALNRVERTKIGIYLDAWDQRTSWLEVYRNTLRDCDDCGIALSSEMGGLLEHVVVHGNVMDHNAFVGLIISTFGPGGPNGEHPMNDLMLLNNTLYHNGWNWGGGIAMDNPGALDVVIGNNLCSQNLSFQITVGSDVSLSSQRIAIDHNLIDGFRGDPEGEVYGTAHVAGNPRFANPAAGDFHLMPGSSAIDAGADHSVLQVKTDLDGQPRVFGDRVDIGADEYAFHRGVIALSPSLVPGGRFRMMLAGEAGWTYTVETSEDLKRWTILADLFSATNGVVIAEVAVTNAVQRFFRAVVP